MSEIIGSAVISVELDASDSLSKLKSEMASKFGDLKNRIQSLQPVIKKSFDFKSLSTSLKTLERDFTKAFRIFATPVIGVGIAAVHKFLKSGSAGSKEFETHLNSLNRAFIGLGEKILKVSIFGKNAAGWIDAFASKIRMLSQNDVDRLVKQFLIISGVLLSLKTASISADLLKKFGPRIATEAAGSAIGTVGGAAIGGGIGAGFGSLFSKVVSKMSYFLGIAVDIIGASLIAQASAFARLLGGLAVGGFAGEAMSILITAIMGLVKNVAALFALPLLTAFGAGKLVARDIEGRGKKEGGGSAWSPFRGGGQEGPNTVPDDVFKRITEDIKKQKINSAWTKFIKRYDDFANGVSKNLDTLSSMFTQFNPNAGKTVGQSMGDIGKSNFASAQSDIFTASIKNTIAELEASKTRMTEATRAGNGVTGGDVAVEAMQRGEGPVGKAFKELEKTLEEQFNLLDETAKKKLEFQNQGKDAQLNIISSRQEEKSFNQSIQNMKDRMRDLLNPKSQAPQVSGGMVASQDLRASFTDRGISVYQQQLERQREIAENTREAIKIEREILDAYRDRGFDLKMITDLAAAVQIAVKEGFVQAVSQPSFGN